jgi:hypothetical protein
VDWPDLAAHRDFDLDRRYLLDRRAFHSPLPCEQGSISVAHTDNDLAFTLEVSRQALRAPRPWMPKG